MKNDLWIGTVPWLATRLTVLLVVMNFLVPTIHSSASETQTLRGHVPAAVAHLAPIARLEGSTRLKLAIGLPLRNPAGLTNLLQQLYDPRSPQYHQYLTSGQFADQFGPTDQDYQAVIAFARTNGFTVSGTHPNRLLLDVEASVSDIEKALHLTLRVYPHPTEARTFHAPDHEPSLDLAVPVLDVSGLDDYSPPRPANLKPVPTGNLANATPQRGSGPSGSYRGNDFRTAYVPGVSLDGSGQVVALFEFDGYFPSDITSYESQAGVPNVPLQNVLLDGFNGSAGSDNVEVALDIEMVISMAPGLSKLIVYEAGANGIANDILNRIATDNLAKQISSSWTWVPFISSTEQIFQQFAAQGQSYFNASGDSDAYTGSVDKPADDPYITIVGGTTLTTTGPAGSWESETVWNWGGGSGSSGGTSTSYSIPSWQRDVSMTDNQGSTTLRNLPDVAMVADNVWVVSSNGQTGSFGGTSCAAPLWAGLTALVNQQAATAGRPTVGFLNPALYAIGNGSGYASAFHDITTGDNTSSSSPNKFFAVPGYDLCTGWGTPAGAALIDALAPRVNAPVIVTNGYSLLAESCTPNNGAVDPGETVTVNFTLQNVGAISTTNLVATLQPNSGVLAPGEPQTYGALVAGGAAVSQPFTFTASGACGGTITATLQLQDGPTNLGTLSFALPLGKFVNATTLTQNFDTVGAPSLPAGWSTAASGAQGNWVTTSAASDTGPNAAFTAGASAAGVNELVSPGIAVVSASAQLSFRHFYNLQTQSTSTARDGGVLEIKIGNGAFTDILNAGGSFVSGGYNRTISSSRGNPLAGRQAWSGNSGGFIATLVNLPAAAAGQVVQLKWRCGTDTSTGSVGWYFDTVSVQDGSYACCSDTADLAVSQTISPVPLITGQSLTYTLIVTNAGPDAAYGITMEDRLSEAVAFLSASSDGIYGPGNVVWTLGMLPSGATTNVSVTVTPSSAGLITNTVTVASVTPDPNPADNISALIGGTNLTALIVHQPTNVVVAAGAMASFQVGAVGLASLNYQWFFNETNLLDGANSSRLTLTNVQPDQAGNYSVVVSTAAGFASSAAATLRVLVPPFLDSNSLAVNVTGVSLSLLSVSGLSYTLEFTPSLANPDWQPLAPAVVGTGGTIVLQDTNAVSSAENRFYRVRCE